MKLERTEEILDVPITKGGLGISRNVTIKPSLCLSLSPGESKVFLYNNEAGYINSSSYILPRMGADGLLERGLNSNT